VVIVGCRPRGSFVVHGGAGQWSGPTGSVGVRTHVGAAPKGGPESGRSHGLSRGEGDQWSAPRIRTAGRTDDRAASAVVLIGGGAVQRSRSGLGRDRPRSETAILKSSARGEP